MKYRVLVEQDEDGFFMAEVPALPGCISQGAIRAEALASIREAIAGYLASLEEHQDPIPPSIHEEIVEVQVAELPVVSGREAVTPRRPRLRSDPNLRRRPRRSARTRETRPRNPSRKRFMVRVSRKVVQVFPTR